MRDILGPRDSKNKIIDIRRKLEPSKKPVVASNMTKPKPAESFVLKSKPEKRKKNKILILFMVFVLILAGIVGFLVYKYSFSNKAAEGVKAQETDEFQDLDSMLKDIDTETESIKNDSSDAKPPVMDLNVSI